MRLAYPYKSPQARQRLRLQAFHPGAAERQRELGEASICERSGCGGVFPLLPHPLRLPLFRTVPGCSALFRVPYCYGVRSNTTTSPQQAEMPFCRAARLAVFQAPHATMRLCGREPATAGVRAHEEWRARAKAAPGTHPHKERAAGGGRGYHPPPGLLHLPFRRMVGLMPSGGNRERGCPPPPPRT